MTYKIEFSRVAKKQLKKLPADIQARIENKIDELAENPRPNEVKKLKGDDYAYRIRVGKYRVFYDIFDDVLLITVVEIGYRSKVYKDV